jgi:hypothetical protein
VTILTAVASASSDVLFYIGGFAVTARFLLALSVGALIGIGIRALIAAIVYVIHGCGGL